MISSDTSLAERARGLLDRLRGALGSDDPGHRSVSSTEQTASTTETRTATRADEPLLADGGDETLSRSELAGATGVRPERYVQQLLAEHDGRLRQRKVSELTRLSASTTSRLLSEMEAEDQITRVSVGREKVVCLPSEAPEIGADRSTERPADRAA